MPGRGRGKGKKSGKGILGEDSTRKDSPRKSKRLAEPEEQWAAVAINDPGEGGVGYLTAGFHAARRF
jgi:hypothetical protein